MKILHTSDLHWGSSWRGQPRGADLERALHEILGLCREQAVDMLLIAGDVFTDRPGEGRGGHAADARRLFDHLRPLLDSQKAVFLLRGNHDQLGLFQLMDTLVREMEGDRGWRLTVAALPGVYPVPGFNLQVVAMPYVERNWLREAPARDDENRDDRNVLLTGRLQLYLDYLQTLVNPKVPAIFTAHMLVRGANLTEDFEAESHYLDEICLDRSWLPRYTSYNALGHIHLGQQLQNVAKPTYYSGAPERMNLGERGYTPHVLLVTTPDTPGGVATVESIGLTSCTPFVQRDVIGADGVAEFCAMNVSQNPLGVVTITSIPVGDRASVEEQLKLATPRIDIRWADSDAMTMATPRSAIDPSDVGGTVAAYLNETYEGKPAELERLQRAFASLLIGEPT